MSRTNDWQQEWVDEIRERSHTARSAKNRRRGAGKKSPAKFSTDYLTEKQLRAMDGECKTYRLGSPMTWEEFKEMPNDLKTMYIKKLRKTYSVPDEELAAAMDVDISAFNECLRKLNLSPRLVDLDWYGTDECGRFVTWWVIAKEEK